MSPHLNTIMLHEVQTEFIMQLRLCASVLLRYLYFQNEIVLTLV